MGDALDTSTNYLSIWVFIYLFIESTLSSRSKKHENESNVGFHTGVPGEKYAAKSLYAGHTANIHVFFSKYIGSYCLLLFAWIFCGSLAGTM